MATKNISITEEAYRRLASLKKANESFSEIIIKITGKSDLRGFFGILSKEAGEELEKNIFKNREASKKLSEERHRRLMKDLT